MKLQKLKISELSNYCHLTHQEMNQYVGGYARGFNNFCFFNCMEYFSREICGYENRDHSSFAESYVLGRDGFYGTKDMEALGGPNTYVEDENGNRSINPDLFNFFSHYFNTDASGWTTGSDISSLFAATGSEENTAVMGFFLADGSTAHCVILKGYDAATDTYTYYDPSCSGTEEERTKTVSGSQMLFAGKGGCK